jgi:hypothetical protein
MKIPFVLLAATLASGLAMAGDDYEVKIKERTHACKSPEETYRFWSLARRDKEAAARYSNEKGCLMIPAGYTVALVERDPIAKINGIRLKDDKTIYYVPASDAN